MRKLLLGSVLALVAVSANAEKWHYELSKSDFSANYKSATLKDRENGFILTVDLKEGLTDVNGASIVSIDLPKGIVTAGECRLRCKAEINVDGQKNAYPPLQIFEFSNFQSYGVADPSSANFLDILRKSKVVKVQLPTFRGGYAVATFVSDEPFNDEKLLNVK